MNETARVQSVGNAARPAGEESVAKASRRAGSASIRVSPGGYLAVLCLLTFVGLLLVRAGLDLPALAAFALAWIVTPALAFTDRVVFNGRELARRGVVPSILRAITGRTFKIALEQIERVETGAVRTIRRGGRVRYRYRSEVIGDGISFVFASGGGSYRKMVRTLFSRLSDEKLDARSVELRDYLADPKVLHQTLKSVNIAPSSVLENATLDLRHGARKGARALYAAPGESLSEADFERGRLLRRAANELRVAGRLREAAEAFRRALLVAPTDGWLIYEFARCLRSQASASGDARLLSRASAGLRLAAKRGRGDASLLARIGESFYENGSLADAGRQLQRALDINPATFRASIGLAEVALRSGKLAHVIHHYNEAARIAPDKALALYARRESEYYSRLNTDEDYLAAELRRIGWLQNLHGARRLATRAALGSILLTLFGSLINESIPGIGWSLASSSIIALISISVISKFLSPRRKVRPAE